MLKRSAEGIMITILIYVILIPSAVFCDSAETQICSVYKKVDINNNSDNVLNSISEPKSYNFSSNGDLSMDIEIKYECDTLMFNTENLEKLDLIQLKSVQSSNSYTTGVYLINKKGLLQITFAYNLPRGNYSLYLKYNRGVNSPIATLHEWLVLTNFDDNNFDKTNNHAMRIWIRKNALGHGKYLIENVENLMKAFENYTGILYKENKHVKFDFIVLPKSHASKYNDGDFIYVDEELFVDEEYIATDGNEKLLRDITEILISEAFKYFKPNLFRTYGRFIFQLREYLKYYIINKAINSWHLMDEYVRYQRYRIFENDYLYGHLNEYVLFDNYPNGGFLIRMAINVIGEENSINALREYLKERKNVQNTDLFSEFIDIPRKIVFDSWVSMKGYPVISINRDYNTNKAIIKQSRFLRKRTEKSSTKYWIPMNFASENDADFSNTAVTDWFDPELASVEISAPPRDKWLIANKQQFGYYRVNYDEKNWKLIIQYLKSDNYHKIHVLNRAQLIDDAFVLAEFGYLNFNIAFDLARYLTLETEYVPWATFWEKMLRLFQYSSISNSQYYEVFKTMILELSESLEITILSDEVSTDNDRMKRLQKISFIKWTCFYGSRLCRSYTLTKLENWLTDPVQNPLLPDIRREMLCAGIRSANKDTWNKLLSKFLINKDNDILMALMCSSDNQLLQKLMTMFVNGELVYRNSWSFYMNIAQQSTNGVDAILEFIYKNLDLFHKNSIYNDIMNNGCVVIEQFISNDLQLEKFYRILTHNFGSIGIVNSASYWDTATDKVRRANKVFDLMKL